ncbi:solute carrier family 23 member 1-like [Lytechinus variegatus]|uniref:solute carrier family 23 member 1-like n=1 Tax=Lytechinus variegatus TaxID=7654 RepID=UPI001BB1C0A9|nr:solute carrier family 23 member 1-like [Lytechinus variegatus]
MAEACNGDRGIKLTVLETERDQQDMEKEVDIEGIAKERADDILEKTSSRVMYDVDDIPPWYTTILISFQNSLGMFSGALSVPLVVAPFLCILDDHQSLSRVFASTFFVSSLQTLLQTSFGVRLPIVQGPTMTFVLPMFTLMSLRGECPVIGGKFPLKSFDLLCVIFIVFSIIKFQGALLIASLFETLVGFLGIVTLVMRFIGPITIATTVGLIGFSLFEIAIQQSQSHWGISALRHKEDEKILNRTKRFLFFSPQSVLILVVIFSQYMERLMVPCLSYSKEKGFHVSRFPVFRVFPIFLATLLGWLLCYILTITEVFPSDPEAPGYRARTDIKDESLKETGWFFVPYPGQWGAPIFTIGGILGVTAGTFASIIESIGDYYACARLAGAPPPPGHALNRGIGMEGLGGFFSALWGTGTSSTSYSDNVGYIGITKVGSRLVIQVMAVTVLGGAFLLKISAFFASIPLPVVGGIFSVTIGMIAAVGMSNLQYVDMNSPRNLFVVGLSFFLGLALPQHMQRNPNLIQTGSDTLDQVLLATLSTSMFVGGVVACFLDNTVPGTIEERGMDKYWKLYDNDKYAGEYDEETERKIQKEVARIVNKCYDMPFGMARLRSWSWTYYVPFSPTFKGFNIRRGCKKREAKES